MKNSKQEILEKKQRGAEAKSSASSSVEDNEYSVYGSLVAQLGDESALRRESACWLLGELRYRPADKIISRLLTKDDDPLVRYGATHALERIADTWAVQAIIRGLNDNDTLVKRACIDSLGRLQDKQAVYPLEELIRHEKDNELVTLAKGALLNIRGQKVKNSSSNEKKIYKYLQQTELKPDSANAHYNLAVAYFHASRLKESRQHCQQAKRLGANVGWLVNKLDAPVIDAPVIDDAPTNEVNASEVKTGEMTTIDKGNTLEVEIDKSKADESNTDEINTPVAKVEQGNTEETNSGEVNVNSEQNLDSREDRSGGENKIEESTTVGT